MHRRDFLKGSSAAALGLGTAAAAAASAAKAADDARTLGAPAIVPERRTLRMVSVWPDAVSGPGDHVRRFAKRIEAATEGRWAIEIADAPVAGADAFKAVMTGEADLYAGHEHGHRDLHPAFSYFAGLPCGTGMDVDQCDAWLIAAGGQELWDDLAAEFNMKGLLIGHSGPAQGLHTLKPIPHREYFQGRRLAVMGLAADVLKAIDAVPVECTTPTLATLIEDNTLDGVELIGTSIEMNPRRTTGIYFDKTFWMNRPLNDSGYTITLGLRRSLWDGLANSEQVVLTALAAQAMAESRADARADAVFMRDPTRSYTPPMKDRIKPTSRDRIASELTRIAETLVADLSGHEEHARRINASYMAFKGNRSAAPSA